MERITSVGNMAIKSQPSKRFSKVCLSRKTANSIQASPSLLRFAGYDLCKGNPCIK